MKKLLALVLAMLMLVPVMLTGCGNDEEKGAEIQMFLAALPTTLDPAASYTTTDQTRLMGLIYEGLFTIDEDGKLEKALCKDYEYDYDERTGYLDLFISLENSRWSDGNKVTADDFRFAWKRIILPEKKNSNAALLYPILNAKNVKEGLCSEDDFGVYAIDSNTIQIRFEKDFLNEDEFNDDATKKQVEYFLRRLASPALVPLRQDVVDDNTKEWCSPNGTSYVTNGPFKIKAWNSGELTFERSVNYRCVGDSDSNPNNKIVKPYRLITLYSEGTTADKHFERFENMENFYINLGSASSEKINEYIGDVQSDSLLSTYCIYLDTSNELFKDPRVRTALSMAIDRRSIAFATFTTPATGLIPAGVEDVSKDKDFRKEGGALISSLGDIDGAKQLLAEAGIDPSRQKIAIDYSDDTFTDQFIANALYDSWSELGFRVQLSSKTQKFIDSKETGDYPLNQTHEDGGVGTVILVNLQSQTPDAYSMLTAVSSEFGGTYIDVTTADVEYSSHVTGYSDKTYNDLVSQFIFAKSDEYRVALMHKAEEYLISKMPVIPVVFNRANYITQDLSKYKTDKFGRLNFTELNQKNYKDYIDDEEE